MLRVSFSYTDEFDQISSLTKTLDESVLTDSTPFDMLINEFKCFLKGAGFANETVDKIGYIEE
jgi:hypothetical protein